MAEPRPFGFFTRCFPLLILFTAASCFGQGLGTYMMTKSVPTSGCQPPTPATTFLTSDAGAYVWFNVSNASVGYFPIFEWHFPNFSVYKSDAPWSPVTAPGSYCYWAKLDIAGQSPASSPGRWSVSVFSAGTLYRNPFSLFYLYFDIQAPPRVTLNSRTMTRFANTALGVPCQTPTPASAFWTTETRVFVWFSISNGAVGDEAALGWMRPDGTVYKTAHWNGLTAPGSYCFSDFLNIAGQPPATSPGSWTANGYWNGSLLFSLPFSIQAPVVNAASYSALSPAPGSISSVFGRFNFPFAFADRVPLPTILGTVQVLINGIPVPLFFVSPGQINFQIPWQLQGVTQASLSIVGTGYNETRPINLAGSNPGMFATNQQGNGQGAILISNTPFFAAPSGAFAGSRPVQRGEFVSIFCTGLGPAFNQPPSGATASADAPSITATAPTVNIGGQPAQISFSGLAPGSVGLYQVDAEVPANAPSGNAVPVVLTIGGVTSNTVTIAVE